ncbi:MAG: ATP synthase F0 subunit B [Proteobacteria bacterium]|nr:ATP synthase F0 subunit B [Pseudomonadota bacterium]
MFKREGKNVIWPWIAIAAIVALFATHYALVGTVTDPLAVYMVETWLPLTANYGIIFIAIIWFAVPAIAKMLRDRKERIALDILDSLRSKSDAEELYAQTQSRLADIEDEIQTFRDNDAEATKNECESIRHEAERQAVRMADDARQAHEVQVQMSMRAFEHDLMNQALIKAREEIDTRLRSNKALRDHLIEQGIASLKLNPK